MSDYIILFAASLFFLTYEVVKYVAGGMLDPKWSPFVHMTAASAGETVSDLPQSNR